MDSGYLVCTTLPTVLFRFFSNFTDVLTMLLRYACGLDIICQFNFITFSKFDKLSRFSGIFTNVKDSACVLGICYSQIIFV